ncbi:ribosomal rna small subunit methyltransferase nep1 [Nannochloropsis gaditana]|uniref:Ribosomal rna small subunit methyltransferase nep1 n=1 Tax=Nannochloropsis gaditana TaxID=72520 RepID=W7TYD3_9STRA|nr:ribosomal rna small subunit methyltransferase nep1 [Nannochloropsis gaditana]
MAEPESSHDVTESLRNKEVITVVLDKASLETVKMKSGQYCLLNCDDHQAMMKKSGKNPADYRPDILHQELLALLDSPLNKVGKLKVYIRSSSNVLIEVNAKCRIPRTYKRFAGLMVQLLHKLKVRSADGKATLLKVIKNPVTRYLPAGFKCYGFSVQGTLYNPNALACTLPDDKPVVFVLGAMAAGHITVQDHPYVSAAREAMMTLKLATTCVPVSATLSD